MGKSILREKRERSWASAATYSLKNKQPGRVACAGSRGVHCVATGRGGGTTWCGAFWGLRGIGALQRTRANGRREQRMVQHTVCPIKHRHGSIL